MNPTDSRLPSESLDGSLHGSISASFRGPLNETVQDDSSIPQQLSSSIAGLSLYQSIRSASTPSATSSSSPVALSSIGPQHPPSGTLKITNIPGDTTLREAFLVFSLCLDQVAFVDIVHQPTSASSTLESSPLNLAANGSSHSDGEAAAAAALSSSSSSSSPLAIVARFVSSQTARQVAQLLDHKCVFGSAYPPVHVEFVDDSPSHHTPVFFKKFPIAQHVSHSHSRLLFSNPFQHGQQPPQQHQQSSPLSPPPLVSLASLSQPPHVPSSAMAHPSSSSSSSNSANGVPTSGTQSSVSAPSSASQRPSVTAQKVLDQLTSPLLPSSGQNLLMLDDYNPLVHPWGNHPSTPTSATSVTTPQSSKMLAEPLSVNTGLTVPVTGSPTLLSAGLSSSTPSSEWDRRPLQYSQLSPPSSSPQLSSKQLPPSQTAQQQQMIPELSLLARIPPPTNPADQNPPCNTLYVGNLPPDATEMELRTLFQPQKGFRRLSFKNKQSNGNSHHGPMCFVEFEDVAHAARALAELYGRTLPRSGGSAKGGIRLSFSKNPLGVRGPGQARRGSGNYHAGASNGSSNNNNNGNGSGNHVNSSINGGISNSLSNGIGNSIGNSTGNSSSGNANGTSSDGANNPPSTDGMMSNGYNYNNGFNQYSYQAK
ncbi:hypothetical protein FOA43_004612 [Brettanomyces nanus]|uniref:RRM domain-containing protein n=1 Tax=Eeniella nana TaxID=13502 RepID=A0A875SAZ6_EENNA|nr:uncharacterized protein FOA43_004612 [Brettanomyces nanus]QPG77205.1 hypothetical protein FOA43_004612 [Brettanomyces nanus]